VHFQKISSFQEINNLKVLSKFELPFSSNNKDAIPARTFDPAREEEIIQIIEEH
jgi:hypothetical protein